VSALYGRLAVDWPPILTAARELCEAPDDSNALGAALGTLIDAIPDEAIDRRRTATGDCPNSRCGHLSIAHEAGDHADDGTPIRVICTVEGCPCGQQWRDETT
jgi:hypothetical protein